ncbi:MAG TPA: hypothetical protein VIV11_32150, partial [Kofleriaceae bacterium]
WLALGATCSIVAAAAVVTRAGGVERITDRRSSPSPAMPKVTDVTCVEPAAPIEQAAPLSIEVVASRTQIARGEPLPLSYYIVNRTTQTLPVLRSLDASDMGWRYPKIEIDIRDANGQQLGHGASRCGLVNPLTATDFVELASGARVDLFGKDAFGHYKLRDTSHLAPGRYTVSLRYDLSFTDIERKGTFDDSVRAKIDRLPKGVYSSPPMTIDIK